MEISEEEWAAMKAELAELRGLVGSLMDVIRDVKDDTNGRLNEHTALINELYRGMAVSAKGLNSTMHWIKDGEQRIASGEEMIEAIREKVVEKPMPGEPSSN